MQLIGPCLFVLRSVGRDAAVKTKSDCRSIRARVPKFGAAKYDKNTSARTRNLGADKSHERRPHGGDGDGEDDSEVVLHVTEFFPHIAAGPRHAVPVAEKRTNTHARRRD